MVDIAESDLKGYKVCFPSFIECFMHLVSDFRSILFSCSPGAFASLGLSNVFGINIWSYLVSASWNSDFLFS